MKENFDIISEVEKLNIRIYQLYIKLERYKDKMSETAFRYLSEKIFLVYREEFEKMYEDYGIERDQARFIRKKKRAKLIPREWWFAFRKNRAAKKFNAEVSALAKTFFDGEPQKQETAEQSKRAADATTAPPIEEDLQEIQVEFPALLLSNPEDPTEANS